MLIKSFSTHKRGSSVKHIQDSVVCDEAHNRFAISDGVSKSFLPRVWADILTEAYLSVDDVELFPPNGLPRIFEERRNKYMKELSEETRMLQEMLEEEFRTASATFAGVEVGHGRLKWTVLGDSCIFVLPKDGLIQCLCSNDVSFDREGKISVAFDNRPKQFMSDGSMYGNWGRGTLHFKEGIIVIMSDAMSNWFIRQYNEDMNPVQQLLKIENDEDFETFVEAQYKQNLLDSDDESFILLQVDETVKHEVPDVDEALPPENDAQEDKPIHTSNTGKKSHVDFEKRFCWKICHFRKRNKDE